MDSNSNGQSNIQSYAGLTPAQAYLYSSPDSGVSLFAMATKYQINSSYRDFAIIVGDVILGTKKVTELTNLLQEQLHIEKTLAEAIARDLLDFLAPLSDPSWQPPKNNEPVEIAAEVLAMEQALTEQYQQPQNEEPVYTSTQSAILREGASSTPAAPNEPRWDSAR
jgi:hypothetical protein